MIARRLLEARRSFSIDAAFLLGVPIFLGAVLGANQTRAGAFLPWGLSIAYWIGLSLSTWLAFALATFVVERLLRPWLLPLWVSWTAGALVGSLAARPVIYLLADQFRPWMSSADLRQMRTPSMTFEFLAYYAVNWGFVIALWIAACWAHLALRSLLPPHEELALAGPMPSRRGEDAELPSGTPERTSFLNRLPPSLRGDVLALQSEDHYVRVHTTREHGLVLGSLGEAIAAFEALGLAGQRVHRSWWVACGSVAANTVVGRKQTLRLKNGLEVPVSQTYRELTRRSELLSDVPTRTA